GRNLIGGEFRPGSSAQRRVLRSPRDGRVIGELSLSDATDVHAAVSAAERAAPEWARTPIRERAECLRRFRQLLEAQLAELSQSAASESGKTPEEARAGLLRGLEVIDFALSLPNTDAGGALEVSRGVTCEYRREPLGVVAGITPFNFPAMVPLWMFPIALTVGNAFILKPSEKVPLTACRLGELALQAGYPAGVFSIIHGERDVVESLVEHPGVRAVGFVGSTRAAQAVYARATAHGKRALCLGGAKNPVIVAPDADPHLTVRAVVDSFTGCAGQRCMAASLLIAVGDTRRIVDEIAGTAARMVLGRDMGALIDAASRERLIAAIADAERDGARLLCDGRAARAPQGCENGNWLGATVIDDARPDMPCVQAELFGPVLSVVHVDTLEQAMALENAGTYGNATSIFTSSGAVARYVTERAASGMLGVNVGVPVPREPFSFGGTRSSKFGHGDITGPAGVEFWSNLKKITTKWALQPDTTWMS
ncbi:MAG TPA: CoA-acylating methylmalonate-semialdehyde dehydrogenase, partial [Polyangiaceae bacterium]|nr:CoA-acylating methylmalonate-semialdehyde dehydrogenase [Polyangiaceae bacterium]